jgi:hypothetical protein
MDVQVDDPKDPTKVINSLVLVGSGVSPTTISLNIPGLEQLLDALLQHITPAWDPRFNHQVAVFEYNLLDPANIPHGLDFDHPTNGLPTVIYPANWPQGALQSSCGIRDGAAAPCGFWHWQTTIRA